MRQLRLHGVEDLRLEERDPLRPAEGEVVVKVAMCGICGTDLSFLKLGGRGGPGPQPLPLGHEFSGWVESVGNAVEGFIPGQRVVVNPMADGNMIGFGDTESGGFADYAVVRNVRDGHALHELPDDLPFERATLIEPISVALHGVRVAQTQPGERVVVFGAGPIGLGTVIALRHLGAGKIIAVDVVPERLERAKALGADEVIDVAAGNLTNRLYAILGTRRRFWLEGADADVFIDAAGNGKLLEQMVHLAGPGTRISLVAQHKGPVSLDLGQFLTRQLKLLASSGYVDEFIDVLAMLRNPAVTTDAMVSHHFKLAEFGEAFGAARRPAEAAKVLVSSL